MALIYFLFKKETDVYIFLKNHIGLHRYRNKKSRVCGKQISSLVFNNCKKV